MASNPIEVDFQWPAGATNPPVTFVPADLPVIADLGGSVVDDETGAPVKDFWVQAGVANPEKPGEMIWSENYRGPSLTDSAARFSVQVQRAGQNWRVLADGYVPQPILPHPATTNMPLQTVMVRLKRGNELHGTIVDSAAKPVAGARVLLTTWQTPELADGFRKHVSWQHGCFRHQGTIQITRRG